MEYLSKLFGSPARVRILRLFAFNGEQVFDRDGVVQAARVSPDVASKECAALSRAGVLVRKTFYREALRPGSATPKRRKAIGWTANDRYPHLEALTRFLRDTLTVTPVEIKKRFRNVGTVKLLVLGGFLAGARDGEIELMLAGDRLDETAIRAAVRLLEAEAGMEIRYALMPTSEFQYRRRVRDRLVRSLYDHPHQILVDRIAE